MKLIYKKTFEKLMKLIIKLIIIIFYIFIHIKSKFIKFKKLEKKLKYKYFFCFTSMGKLENKYVKELIDYYKMIGVDKFYLADNNDKNSEKLSDILNNYIKDGFLDIIDVTNIKKDQTQMFGEVYEKHKSECRWMSFFDFDEYLEFRHANNIINIQTYFSKSKFEKCNVILIILLVRKFFFDS